MNRWMKLEWRKLKQKSIIGEVVIYLVILMFIPVFFIKVVSADFGKDFDTLFTLMQSVQRGMILFGASLISQVFIEEYKSKTLSLSFGYPISRQKLFTAKILFIALFVFLITISSYLLTGITMYLVNAMFPVIDWQPTGSDIAAYLTGMVMHSFFVTLISFIPLFFFGIWRKAVVPTVICAIVAMNLPHFSGIFQLSEAMVIAILCLIGALSIILTVKTAERLGDI